MNSLETSSIILSDTPTTTSSKTTAPQHRLYIWSAVIVALLVALMNGALTVVSGLPTNFATLNGIASLLTLAVVPAALAAALGIVLNRSWGKTLLAVAGLLMLGVAATGILYLVSVMNAGYSYGYVARLMTGFLLAFIAFIPTVCLWLAYFAVRRSSNTLATIPLAIIGLFAFLAVRMIGIF